MNSKKFPTDILKKLVLNTPNTYFYGFWFDQIKCELEQLDDLFSKDPSENNLSYQKKQQMLNFIAKSVILYLILIIILYTYCIKNKKNTREYSRQHKLYRGNFNNGLNFNVRKQYNY